MSLSFKNNDTSPMLLSLKINESDKTNNQVKYTDIYPTPMPMLTRKERLKYV